MGLVVLIVGLLMVVTGAQGTYAQFAKQVGSEFQGPNSFLYWIIAITAAGAIGYIPALQIVSRYLLALIILAIFLSHKGFFAQLQSALASGPVQPQAGTGNVATSSSLPAGAGVPSPGQPGAPSPGNPTANAPSWFQNFFPGASSPAY